MISQTNPQGGFVNREAPTEVVDVVVVELHHRAEPEPRAVDDAGVVELVDVDHVAALDQGGDHPEVDLEACTETKGGFLFYKFCKFLFKFNMYIKCAVQKPGTPAPGVQKPGTPAPGGQQPAKTTRGEEKPQQ